MPMVPTSEGLDPDLDFFSFESEGEESAHNPLVMPFLTAIEGLNQ